MPTDPPRRSGRAAQAARNDKLILESARDVFLADPDAPISAVARQAGVGISALYSRYPRKEDLLRKLATDGLARIREEIDAALHDDRDPWTVFAEFMGRLVDADVAALTLALAGKFTPTEDMWELASSTDTEMSRKLFPRVKPALRPGAGVGDIPDQRSGVVRYQLDRRSAFIVGLFRGGQGEAQSRPGGEGLHDRCFGGPGRRRHQERQAESRHQSTQSPGLDPKPNSANQSPE